MKTEKKHNCYECEYRSNISGDTHSKCSHPTVKKCNADPWINILGMLASVGRELPLLTNPAVLDAAIECGIKMNIHGVEKGWANWPINFDPVWIDECTGYKCS